MKLLILFVLSLSTAWAKPIVVVSYYDAFGKAPFNNSEKVAKALAAKFNRADSPISLKLCALNTIFDKAYAQTEDCMKALPEKPAMVLGLGESGCELKVETMMRNNDRSQGADNARVSRNDTVIVAEAPSIIGLTYPLPQMYCALTKTEQGLLNLSNDAGSFVCNNTAFQMSHFHPEVQYGFIHVPSHDCRNLERKTETSVTILEKMIVRGAKFLTQDSEDEGLPHSSNEVRLATGKVELRQLRNAYANKDDCLHDYLKRARGHDERRSFFFGGEL